MPKAKLDTIKQRLYFKEEPATRMEFCQPLSSYFKLMIIRLSSKQH